MPLHTASAQEVPRPSLVRQQLKTPPTDYNLKIGQVLLTADAVLRTEFIDNVYLSASDVEEDFVVNPEFGLNAAWQVTQLNVLRLRTSIGYTKYLDHPELDTQNLGVSPNSALSFEVHVADVRIEFHDQFSLQNETIGEGSLSGIAKLPRFTNIAGVSLLWDMNDLIWSLGYDRYNLVTLGTAVSASGDSEEDLSHLDHSTDQISTSVVVKLNATTILGLDATVAYSDYPNDSTANFTSYSAGPLLEVQVTKYSSLFATVGFKGYSFVAGPETLVQVDEFGSTAVLPGREAGFEMGYYANATLVHRLNRYYSDRLQLGHEDQSDAFSGRIESNYARYDANWNFNSHWMVGLGLFFEDVHVSAGNIAGLSDSGDYMRWGGRLSTGYKLTAHMNLSLTYQLTQKKSDKPTQDYTQNRLALGVLYRF